MYTHPQYHCASRFKLREVKEVREEDVSRHVGLHDRHFVGPEDTKAKARYDECGEGDDEGKLSEIGRKTGINDMCVCVVCVCVWCVCVWSVCVCGVCGVCVWCVCV